jgi:Zn-dependent protease with chaperone function
MQSFAAQYKDGHPAVLHNVTVICDVPVLAIASPDRRIEEAWAWKDVKLAEPVSPGRPLHLMNRANEDERLTFEDHAILPLLRNLAPYLERDPVRGAAFRKYALIAGAIAALALLVVYGMPRLAEPLAKLVPLEWEEQIGAGIADQVSVLLGAKEGACRSPGGDTALTALTSRLARTVETPYRFRVRVADSKEVNAFAVPGGYIVIFKGLLDKADNPDEVAGVLAHEMAHVIKRHPTKSLIHAYGWSMLLTMLTGAAGTTSEILGSLAMQLTTASYSRGNEAEADAVAVEILAKAHISTDGFVRFFEKLKKESGADAGDSDIPVLRYLASHPGLQERIDAVKGAAKPSDGVALDTASWQALKKICGD